MKNLGKIFLLALLQTGVVLVLPLFMRTGVEIGTEVETEPVAEVMAAEETVLAQDSEYELSIIINGEMRKLTMADYLFGVVAAEMPASFETEALKAQTAAARTYALYRIASSAHGGAVCGDYSCCQAWLSEEELRAKWDEDYETYAAKIRMAIEETDGQCITYDGAPILAAFHSSSNGMTESSENVFGKALPYLLSVESNEDSETVPNYVSCVEFTETELYAAVAAWNSEAAIKVSEGALLSQAVFSTSGRLISIELCGEKLSGSELRRVFSLRSADVSWQLKEGGIVFTVTGYGHGVGMSQYGANNMAKHGAKFDEILRHYYPGTDMKLITELEENAALL